MTALREAAQKALEALEYGQHTLKQVSENQWESRGQLAIEALRAALAEPMPDSKHATIAEWWAEKQHKPLTEEEIEKAYREIWRDLTSDFDHTSYGWIEQGIKYAERAHGIKNA